MWTELSLPSFSCSFATKTEIKTLVKSSCTLKNFLQLCPWTLGCLLSDNERIWVFLTFLQTRCLHFSIKANNPILPSLKKKTFLCFLHYLFLCCMYFDTKTQFCVTFKYLKVPLSAPRWKNKKTNNKKPTRSVKKKKDALQHTKTTTLEQYWCRNFK